MNFNYYVNSFFWSFTTKIIDSLIRFISIPLLLGYLGQEYFGILTLAIATNAYMQLLNLGINTGAVKFYSQWKAEGKLGLLERVSRTSISFYVLIGILNAFVLLIIVFWGGTWFNLLPSQFHIFKTLLLLLVPFSIINWTSAVFSQLLVADEKLAFVQKVSLGSTFLYLVIVVITITFKLSIYSYFFLFLLGNSLIVVPIIIKCKSSGLISSFVPQTYWKDFNIVFKYSLAIFAMGVFSIIAIKSRPIVLAIFSKEGVSILTQYRIIEVFPLFIISIGGIMISIFLPKASKMVSQNNQEGIRKLAYEGTTYTSILVALLCFPIIISSKELLTLYVGNEYSNLYVWLSLWCFTILLYLHNTPVASLVLASGKVRMLILSSAIACTTSIIINALLTNVYGVGSAVIGYLVYIVIQMSFYYFYFNRKVLNLKSWEVFKSFIIPTSLGLFSLFLIQFINIQLSNIIIQGLVKIVMWVVVYLSILTLFKILKYKSMILLLKSK